MMSFGGLTFGMTKSQVERRLGKPESTRGRCWVYPDEVGQRLASEGVVKSVVDVCFLSGRYSDYSSESYVRRHGKLMLYHPPVGPGS
jgi:hypothetical protein